MRMKNKCVVVDTCFFNSGCSTMLHIYHEVYVQLGLGYAVMDQFCQQYLLYYYQTSLDFEDHCTSSCWWVTQTHAFMWTGVTVIPKIFTNTPTWTFISVIIVKPVNLDIPNIWQCFKHNYHKTQLVQIISLEDNKCAYNRIVNCSPEYAKFPWHHHCNEMSFCHGFKRFPRLNHRSKCSFSSPVTHHTHQTNDKTIIMAVIFWSFRFTNYMKRAPTWYIGRKHSGSLLQSFM